MKWPIWLKMFLTFLPLILAGLFTILIFKSINPQALLTKTQQKMQPQGAIIGSLLSVDLSQMPVDGDGVVTIQSHTIMTLLIPAALYMECHNDQLLQDLKAIPLAEPVEVQAATDESGNMILCADKGSYIRRKL